MDMKEMKDKYIGTTLKLIMRVENISEHTKLFRKILGVDSDYYYGDEIESIYILFIDEKKFIAFVDFDCDGYRSGNWFVIDIANWTDTGGTTVLKKINSIIRNIEYIETESKVNLLITTDKYVIMMGQDGTDDYYPRNFFDVEETKKHALTVLEGDVLKLEESE